ncbi:MAG: bis(5'-nucleosyl)-tetraphosphatase [Endomicrobiales bacterium]
MVRKEYAAGAVVFREEGGAVRFLLVYSRRNGIWGFPKGHIEPGEDEKSAAAREIAEEAGITELRWGDGFRGEDVYQAKSTRQGSRGETIEKHSVYFLAGTPGPEVRVDNDEISAFRWTSLEEALALLPFEGIKDILREAAGVLGQRR